MSFEDVNFYILIVFYLIGSIPFALLVQKILKTNDPRISGSRNPGATNMYRIAGPKAGAITFLGDFFKGYFPILIVIDQGLSISYFYSFIILFGHMFSIFNKFKGGKGVATSFGFLFAIDLNAGFIMILIWITVFILMRISGLSAIVSFMVLPAVIYYTVSTEYLYLLSIAHSLIILFNHRKNIRELLYS